MEQKKELSFDQMEKISGGKDEDRDLIAGYQECPVCHEMIKLPDYVNHVKACGTDFATSEKA